MLLLLVPERCTLPFSSGTDDALALQRAQRTPADRPCRQLASRATNYGPDFPPRRRPASPMVAWRSGGM
eukprot:1242937-Pleurochrysis_carterae.AAC.2